MRAEAVCRELGRGALLDRMSAGLHQAVGEAAGSCRTASARAFTWLAPFSSTPTSSSSTRVSRSSIPSLLRAVDTLVRRAPVLFVVAHS
jgi:hypothetical protein